jgi:hypothetical protein
MNAHADVSGYLDDKSFRLISMNESSCFCRSLVRSSCPFSFVVRAAFLSVIGSIHHMCQREYRWRFLRLQALASASIHRHLLSVNEMHPVARAEPYSVNIVTIVQLVTRERERDTHTLTSPLEFTTHASSISCSFLIALYNDLSKSFEKSMPSFNSCRLSLNCWNVILLVIF